MGDSINKLSHNKLLLKDDKILLRDFILIQVIHKESVPPSDRDQTPHEGFHYKLYINTVYLLLRDAKLLLRDSIITS